MNVDRVTPGRELPDDFNVIIEIPMNADPIKYEVDKESGALFVDRFMMTAMRYPCNYGYIPHTLSEEGDPANVLVITPFPVNAGAVIRCRPIGVLKMVDEAGGEPSCSQFRSIPYCQCTSTGTCPKTCSPSAFPRSGISSSTTKDLEPGKWVKVTGWLGPEEARAEIVASVASYRAATPKPMF
jgi:inorganic pyrophosphatase